MQKDKGITDLIKLYLKYNDSPKEYRGGRDQAHQKNNYQESFEASAT